MITMNELSAISGISRRNIKYWCNEYKLDVVRKGRTNYYSDKTVQLLKFINYLTKTRMFTKKFIDIIIEYNKNTETFFESADYLKYNKFLNEYSEFLNSNNLLENLKIKFEFNKNKCSEQKIDIIPKTESIKPERKYVKSIDVELL